MNAFPLVRTKWSNEHIMAAVFIVTVLYLLPQWVQSPGSVFGFLVVLAVSLLIDIVVNFIRFKAPVCAVSAAVTAAVLQALTPGVPLWGRLLGIASALLAGKHIWGGTGKNPLNPALVGFITVGLLFPAYTPVFVPTILLLPAMILSLPFIRFRPFAALGLMAGMLSAMLVNRDFNISDIIAFGVIFWGCIIITDPVTTASNPWIGALGGLTAGFIPLYFSGTVFSAAIGVLAFNLLSCAAGDLSEAVFISNLSFKSKRIIPYLVDKHRVCDMTGMETPNTGAALDISAFSKDEILGRIEQNGVFGFGGAAYPTCMKIKGVMESGAPEKHLIINAAECDPGLIHDKWLLDSFPDEIAKGIRLLQKCLVFDTTFIALKDAPGINRFDGISIRTVPDHYPVGAERTLVREVLGIRVPPEEYPSEAGILVINVQTAYSIYEAVYLNRRADTRYITAANMGDRSAKIVRVRLGTRISDVIDAVYPKTGVVFKGGGLMQAQAADEGEAIDKSVNFLAVGDFPNYKESVLCSRCGFCSAVCPQGLKPGRIAELVDQGRIGDAQRLDAGRCISCGSCSYVCLAGRNLAARVKAVKNAV